jgi:hypothetical protein
MIEQDIRDAIASMTTITKIFPMNALEGTACPYITYGKISSPRGSSLDGFNGTVISRFQVTVHDVTYIRSKTNASALYGLVDYTTTGLIQMELVNETDMYDQTLKHYLTILDTVIP